MTDASPISEFAAPDRGRGVVIRTRRSDFLNSEVRAADQGQLLRRAAAHVTAGAMDPSDHELFVDPSELLDQEPWNREEELFFRHAPLWPSE